MGIGQRVFLHGVSWQDYEAFLARRGESSATRATYLSGTLEIMGLSVNRAELSKRMSRLIEAWCYEPDVAIEGFGSYTVKCEPAQRGFEPDECYVLGPVDSHPQVPSLAIEVIWTSGGIDKLEVYGGIGVPEAWIYHDGELSIHLLLDTNILSSLVREPQGVVAQRIRNAGERSVFTSIVVAAELRLGAAKRASERLTRQLEAILAAIEVAPLVEPADRQYAQIRAHLEHRGTPIGPTNLLLAAQARSIDATLVTANVGEFSRVPNLKLENWLDVLSRSADVYDTHIRTHSSRWRSPCELTSCWTRRSLPRPSRLRGCVPNAS